MSEIRDLLRHTSDAAADYLEGIDGRPVFPLVSPTELRSGIEAELGDDPISPAVVIDDLVAGAGPGLVSVAGGRYFGFVTGGSLPAALATDWLAATWDQNAFSYVSSPAASVVEEVASRWVKEVLGLPSGASVAFVTGCQMAHVTALAAARHEVLRKAGWDVSTRGLAGAPPVRVVTGRKRHVTVDRALRLLGLGTDCMELVDVDDQGRIRLDAMERALADTTGPTIVIAQAGEVNTGSFDPIDHISDLARQHDAWLHIDGAFGIWARVNPATSNMTRGIEKADSWAFDAHKWLNVPYDSGVAVVAHPEPHRASMLGEAAYLVPTTTERDAYDWTPEASRRSRGLAVYAALRSLGRRGLADLVERCCAHARRFANALADLEGAEILNDVVLNQVLLAFEDDDRTTRILEAVQGSGMAWMGGTEWEGRKAIRISVSSWATTTEDVDRTLEAFAAAAR